MDGRRINLFRRCHKKSSKGSRPYFPVALALIVLGGAGLYLKSYLKFQSEEKDLEAGTANLRAAMESLLGSVEKRDLASDLQRIQEGDGKWIPILWRISAVTGNSIVLKKLILGTADGSTRSFVLEGESPSVLLEKQWIGKLTALFPAHNFTLNEQTQTAGNEPVRFKLTAKLQ